MRKAKFAVGSLMKIMASDNGTVQDARSDNNCRLWSRRFWPSAVGAGVGNSQVSIVVAVSSSSTPQPRMVKASDMDDVVTVVVPRMTVVAIEVVSILNTACFVSQAAGFAGTTGCRSDPILYRVSVEACGSRGRMKKLTSS